MSHRNVAEFSLSIPYLVLLGAPEQMCECLFHVSRKARRKHVLLGTELMTGLPDNGIDHIQPGNLVFWFALEDEFLHILHDVLVELDGFHSRLRDCPHFRLRNRDLVIVEREELKN